MRSWGLRCTSVLLALMFLTLLGVLRPETLLVNLSRANLNHSPDRSASGRNAVDQRVAVPAERALDWAPDDGRAAVALGLTRVRGADPQGARSAFQHALSHDSGDPLASYYLGNAYWEMGEVDDAAEQWRRASAAPVLRTRIEAARKAGRPEEAEKWGRLAVQIDPGNISTWLALGQSQAAGKQWAAAAATYSEVVRYFPRDRRGYEELALMLGDFLRDIPSARAVVEAGLSQIDGDSAQLNYLRSAYWAGTGSWTELEGYARRAIELSPHNGYYLVWLGELFVRQKRLDEAVAQYQITQEQADDRSWAWRARQREGAVYAARRQWAEAVDRYMSALEESIRQGAAATVVADNRAKLGDQLAASGRVPEAISEYKLAVGLDPARTDLGKRLADLERTGK